MDNSSIDSPEGLSSHEIQSITDLLVALGAEKRVFLATIFLGVCLSVGIALTKTKYYTASTLILPPQQQQSAAATALAQLGALSAVSAMGGGQKTPEELYVALLKSRSVQDALITSLKLQERYQSGTIEGTRRMLSNRISIYADRKPGFISISADDPDPVFAARLANAHIEELRRVISRLALTDAQQRRAFFEQQVNKTKAALNKAEITFRQMQAESGLVVSQALAESGIKESSYLRGQIAAREVQLQTVTRFATSEHPDVQRISAELAALRKQLGQLESGAGKDTRNDARGIRAVQAFRDMKVQEVLLETLIRQLEIARGDESKEGPLLQQIDVAIPPERPSKPSRMSIVLLGSGASILIGLLFAFGNRARKQHGDTLSRMRAAWL